MNWKSVLVTSGRGVQSIVMVDPKQAHTVGQPLGWLVCPYAAWKDTCSTATTTNTRTAMISQLFLVFGYVCLLQNVLQLLGGGAH